jgi:hypothetical protein
MTVSEFIEWLKDRDQDAIVRVMATYRVNHECRAIFVDFEPMFHYCEHVKDDLPMIDLGEE